MRSAQWMSSTSTTSGRRSAEISSARLTAQNVSSAEKSSSIEPDRRPDALGHVLVAGEHRGELHAGGLEPVVRRRSPPPRGRSRRSAST